MKRVSKVLSEQELQNVTGGAKGAKIIFRINTPKGLKDREANEHALHGLTNAAAHGGVFGVAGVT